MEGSVSRRLSIRDVRQAMAWVGRRWVWVNGCGPAIVDDVIFNGDLRLSEARGVIAPSGLTRLVRVQQDNQSAAL